MAGWSVHSPHFFLGKLEQADNKYFPHILSLVLQAKVKSVKPLSHWTATVLRQLVTDIASGSQSSLETVASDS